MNFLASPITQLAWIQLFMSRTTDTSHTHTHTHIHTLPLCWSCSQLLYSDALSPVLCRLGASQPHQQWQGLCASPAREEHRAMSLRLNIWDFLVSQHNPNLRSPGPSVLMPSQPPARHWTRAAWT